MRYVKSLYFRQVAVIVALCMLAIGSIPSKSMAYVVGPELAAARTDRAADMDKAQRVLESKLVSDKLESAGLSMSEIRSRVDRLSDQELHQFASQLDSLYPGGDALGVVIALLVIVILVMVILKLADRKIVIR
ncbi:MAG: PA2779 family protein [Deltaproteobacteria bacterium]|nr:PA2779 family protein [Deltaproteobacteria bacterium]